MLQLSSIKIINARIITPGGLIDGGSLVAEGGKIKAVSHGGIDFDTDLIIDARGNYLSPGFIDIHVHGGGGHDFMDNSVEAFLAIAETHAKYGTTSLTPTTLSCEKDDLLLTLETYERASVLNKSGAEFIGLHIEGPYFAMNQRGAQDPRFIRNPNPEEYKEIINNYSSVKRWSAAPELPGAIDFGRYLSAKGILPAIAHTDAIYEEVMEAFAVGFSHVTHLYSCTSTVTRRNGYRCAGVVETAFLLDNMTVEIIADGAHLPPELLKLVYKLKGAANIALVTDAMRAAGMPPGESILGGLKNGMKVIVEDNVAKLPDRSAFAGSVVTANQLVKNMVTLAGIPLLDAITMMTLTPARIMNVNRKKGTLEEGKDADMVIFDDQFKIQHTIIAGSFAYSREPLEPTSI